MPQLTLEPTPKQHLAWQILEDKTTTDFLFGGGTGGGKSWLGCEWLIVNCLRYPDTRYFIARKTLKNLKKTTLRTFFKVAKYHGLKRTKTGSTTSRPRPSPSQRQGPRSTFSK